MKEEILARKKKCDAKLKEKSILKMHNTKNETPKDKFLGPTHEIKSVISAVWP